MIALVYLQKEKQLGVARVLLLWNGYDSNTTVYLYTLQLFYWMLSKKAVCSRKVNLIPTVTRQSGYIYLARENLRKWSECCGKTFN